MAKVYCVRNLNKYQLVENERGACWSSWCFSSEEGGKIYHWFKIGGVNVGFTTTELERMLKEAQYMENIIKNMFKRTRGYDIHGCNTFREGD